MWHNFLQKTFQRCEDHFRGVKKISDIFGLVDKNVISGGIYFKTKKYFK